MSKTIIRLTESDLHRIVKESVNKILKEGYYEDMYLDDYNDDVECPSCGSNNVEPISAIDTHYRCLDCGEEFYLDSGWEPDWDAMRHESHKRNGKSINEAGRQSYTQKKYNYKTRHSIITDAQNEVTRLRSEITALTQQIRRTQDPQAREQLIAQRQELCKLRNRAVAKVWNLSNERTMTDGAKQRAAIKRKADYARSKNRITFKPEDDPYYGM